MLIILLGPPLVFRLAADGIAGSARQQRSEVQNHQGALVTQNNTRAARSEPGGCGDGGPFGSTFRVRPGTLDVFGQQGVQLSLPLDQNAEVGSAVPRRQGERAAQIDDRNQTTAMSGDTGNLGRGPKRYPMSRRHARPRTTPFVP